MPASDERSFVLDSSEYPLGHEKRRIAIVLFLLVLAVALPLVHPMGEQQASRYAFTAALWDDGTLDLSDYSSMLGRDYALHDGEIQSDKAPGQPFLSVPFYALYRLVNPDANLPEANESHLGVWWLTVWSAVIPGALLAVLMYRWALEIEPLTALAASLTIALGTLLLVYSSLLFGHVLAAVLGFGMFLLVRDPSGRPTYLLAAGFLGGLAVLVEFPVALVVAIVTVAAAVRHRRKVWYVLAGGVPCALALALYNYVAFGDPLSFSYQYSGFLDAPREATEIFPGPSLELLGQVLYSPRGLLVASPVVVMALIGVYLMWRRHLRFDAVVAAAAFGAMLMVQASWSNPYAGGAGPRYLTPGLPFLVAPLAVAWRKWPLSTRVLAAFSLLTVGLATVTEPQLGTQFQAGLRYWASLLFNGEVAPTVWSVMLGEWDWILYVIGIGAAAYILWRVSRSELAGVRNESKFSGGLGP